MNINKFNISFVFIILIMFFSCKQKYIEPNLHYKTNTLFIIEGNNSLRTEALETINEIELGMANDDDDVVLVCVKTTSNTTVLLRIRKDNDINNIISDTIKIYHNSVTTADLLGSISEESQRLFPADTYSLILWSHSTSWYPSVEDLKTKSFGQDNGIDIDIRNLASVLPKNYRFIIFDSCNMASLEVLYEFKDNARYIIASPTEVISTGFPYRKIMKYIISGDLNRIATEYYEYYYNFIGTLQSATISVVDTKELSNLANSFRDLIIVKNQKIFNTEGVQRMDFTDDFPIKTYDFGSYVNHNFNESEKEFLDEKIKNVVIFKRSTPYFNGQLIKYFSGITCFIPKDDIDVNSYYKQLKWSQESGLKTLL